MHKFGLDFGTTNSAIAIEDSGSGKVLGIDDLSVDPRVIRSMLYFNRREIVYAPKIALSKIKMQLFEPGDFHWEGEFKPLIGEAAIERYLSENKNRSQGIKRTIFTGRIISTETGEEVKGGAGAVREYYEEIDYGTGRLLQALKTALKSPYYKGTTIFGQYFSLEELISIFLGQIKKKAEQLLGEKIDEVVCGRPVHFRDEEEKDQAAQGRLEEALKKAGFKKITFEFEPVAAARQFLSLATKGLALRAQTVFVFDFGGGTLDTAIVKVSPSTGAQDKNVLAADGVYIGGDLLNADILKAKLWKYFGAEAYYGDQTQLMPRHIYEALNSWYSIPNLNNPVMMQMLESLAYKNTDPEALKRLIYLIKSNLGFDLYEAIEKAKKELSSKTESVIEFSSGIIEIQEKITKEEFEEIIEPRVVEISQTIYRTLKTAGVEPEEIDVVVRTGGSSLIPVFETLLIEIFGQEKIQQFETFTSIAAGLAL